MSVSVISFLPRTTRGHHRKIVTGAGVSAGIDLALTLAGKIAGPEVAKTIQLAIEYDPHPPFDAGSPSKAPKPIYDMAVAALGD